MTSKLAGQMAEVGGLLLF